MKVSVTIASVAFLSACQPAPATAASAHHIAVPYADIVSLAAEHGQKVVTLSPDQRVFLAGVSALAPDTPPGLPYGDKAAWVVQTDGSAYAFFVDGETAYDGFEIPKALVDMTLAIGRGDVLHAGTAN